MVHRKFIFIILFVLILLSFMCVSSCGENVSINKSDKATEFSLPRPKFSGDVSVETALNNRRSIRDYKDEPLTISELSQILWAAQGVTSNWGGRTAPSAGALYPLELYVVAGNVTGLDNGVYHYKPKDHVISKIMSRDIRKQLSEAALGQVSIQKAPVSIVITGIYERTTKKYGERGVRYVHIEVGHVGQNIYLQAQTLGLGTVMMGAFDDKKVKEVLALEKEEPFAIMPIGKR